MSLQKLVVAVDVGNTRTKFGLFQKLEYGQVQPVSITACLTEGAEELKDVMGRWIGDCVGDPPTAALVAGSDSRRRDQLISSWPLSTCPPTEISGFAQIPVAMDVDLPERVGIDRLLNVFAAFRMQRTPRAVIVVDSGTATTVDLLTSEETFRGGSILPGLRLSARAMHDYTARLPLVSFEDDSETLPRLPGRNTEEAMRAGLFIGQLGAVRELTARLTQAASEQFGERMPPQVVVTGGGGRHLAPLLQNAMWVDCLPLRGLAMLAGYVRGQV